LADVVHVTGWLPTDDAWTLLAGADAAVSIIPRGEIFDVSSPTKLLEYLALSTPCVANDSPDQAWVLAQSGAGLLCSTTPQAIAGGLIEILEAPAVARQRAAAGPAFIRRERSYSVVGARVAEQYQRISARRSGQCGPTS
jgi:glycosyltransferase involved in cell wall biosynthesis